MYTLYGDRRSGNCYKPAFLMRQRNLPFQWVDKDVLLGQTRTPEFLQMNPNGRVPLLQLPDGRYLAESNAMLLYLAEGTPWLPADPYDRAKAYEWLFFEQYSHEPYIATARFWVAYSGRAEQMRERIAEWLPKGYAALSVMEQQLRHTPFLIGAQPSVADLALYAYTHVAHEGGYHLHDYPALRAWLARFEAVPGFLPMPITAP